VLDVARTDIFRIGILADLNCFISLLANTYKLCNTVRRSLRSNKTLDGQITSIRPSVVCPWPSVSH